jgi:C4-dicarboxylate-specific signal transduction histidine kinase
MRLSLWVPIVLFLLLIAVIAWRQISVTSAEKRFESRQQELTSRLEADKASAVARTREALTKQNEHALMLFATALGWTVREAMIRNNQDQIDQYFTQLVKDARVRLALLADPSGKIVVSSDRNFQGAAFSQHFPPALLQESSVSLRPAEGQTKRLVIPIHGLSAPLGVVILDYEAPPVPAS